jgi:hypothetical protein
MTYLLKMMNQLLQKMMIHPQQENDRGLLLTTIVSTRIPRRKKHKRSFNRCGAFLLCFKKRVLIIQIDLGPSVYQGPDIYCSAFGKL